MKRLLDFWTFLAGALFFAAAAVGLYLQFYGPVAPDTTTGAVFPVTLHGGIAYATAWQRYLTSPLVAGFAWGAWVLGLLLHLALDRYRPAQKAAEVQLAADPAARRLAINLARLTIPVCFAGIFVTGRFVLFFASAVALIFINEPLARAIRSHATDETYHRANETVDWLATAVIIGLLICAPFAVFGWSSAFYNPMIQLSAIALLAFFACVYAGRRAPTPVIALNAALILLSVALAWFYKTRMFLVPVAFISGLIAFLVVQTKRVEAPRPN